MADTEKLAGSDFRGWKLGDVLGKGGSAIVYAATRDGLHAAVKIFHLDALEKHGFEEEQQRLELQLKLKGQKQHPNLVEIYDGGIAEELGNTLFLIMEKVPGNTIDKVIQNIPRTSIGPLIKQLAEAAFFLEKNELVHRDIKPENVIVSDDFSHLTLLDLGVVRFLNSEESNRISGLRFVGTPRYSPPEFVWRTELNTIEACRAITFYQIGGTLHDLIMKKRLFDGIDQPLAKLYDSIKAVTPEISADDCDPWLIQLAKSCLVKDWRQRVELVSWDSFSQPDTETRDMTQMERAIRLRQIRRDEIETAKVATERKVVDDEKIKALWELKDQVFLDIRRYATGTKIFPRFGVKEESSAKGDRYMATLEFEKDERLGFKEGLEVQMQLAIGDGTSDGIEIMITARQGSSNEPIFNSKWIENPVLDKVVFITQQALLQIADRQVPQA